MTLKRIARATMPLQDGSFALNAQSLRDERIFLSTATMPSVVASSVATPKKSWYMVRNEPHTTTI